MNRAISRAALRRAASALTSHSQTHHSAQSQFQLGSAPTPYSRAASTMLFSAAAFAAATCTLCQQVHAKEQGFHDDVVFYQFEDCSFSNKIKAFLDYFNIPYKVVEDHSISNKEIEGSKYDKVTIKTIKGKEVVILADNTIKKKTKGSEYEEVLLLTMKGEKFVILSDIISKKEIEEFEYEKVPILTIKGENLVIPTDNINMFFKLLFSLASTSEEKKWLEWVGCHLAPVVALNLSRPAIEVLNSLGNECITVNGQYWRDLPYLNRMILKFGGAIFMYILTKALKRKYNITDEHAALYQAAETWVDALNDRPFLGGSKPNIADLTVFGFLRPICYLQPGKEMVKKTKIGDWLSRMEKIIGDLLG